MKIVGLFTIENDLPHLTNGDTKIILFSQTPVLAQDDLNHPIGIEGEFLEANDNSDDVSTNMEEVFLINNLWRL